MLKGITVTLYTRRETHRDAFNAPVYEEIGEAVENVIAAPTTSEDVLATTQLYGKRAVYQLFIPKGDSHAWEDCKVSFQIGGVEFVGHVFGFTNAYIESMVPNKWNKQAWVEQYG